MPESFNIEEARKKLESLVPEGKSASETFDIEGARKKLESLVTTPASTTPAERETKPTRKTGIPVAPTPKNPDYKEPGILDYLGEAVDAALAIPPAVVTQVLGAIQTPERTQRPPADIDLRIKYAGKDWLNKEDIPQEDYEALKASGNWPIGHADKMIYNPKDKGLIAKMLKPVEEYEAMMQEYQNTETARRFSPTGKLEDAGLVGQIRDVGPSVATSLVAAGAAVPGFIAGGLPGAAATTYGFMYKSATRQAMQQIFDVKAAERGIAPEDFSDEEIQKVNDEFVHVAELNGTAEAAGEALSTLVGFGAGAKVTKEAGKILMKSLVKTFREQGVKDAAKAATGFIIKLSPKLARAMGIEFIAEQGTETATQIAQSQIMSQVTGEKPLKWNSLSDINTAFWQVLPATVATSLVFGAGTAVLSRPGTKTDTEDTKESYKPTVDELKNAADTFAKAGYKINPQADTKDLAIVFEKMSEIGTPNAVKMVDVLREEIEKRWNTISDSEKSFLIPLLARDAQHNEEVEVVIQGMTDEELQSYKAVGIEDKAIDAELAKRDIKNKPDGTEQEIDREFTDEEKKDIAKRVPVPTKPPAKVESKEVEKEVSIQPEPIVSDEQADFVLNKVTELGSAKAVYDAYPTDAKVDVLARTISDGVYGKPEKSVAAPEAEQPKQTTTTPVEQPEKAPVAPEAIQAEQPVAQAEKAPEAAAPTTSPPIVEKPVKAKVKTTNKKNLSVEKPAVVEAPVKAKREIGIPTKPIEPDQNLPKWKGADRVYTKAYKYMEENGYDAALADALSSGNEERIKANMLRINEDIVTKNLANGTIKAKRKRAKPAPVVPESEITVKPVAKAATKVGMEVPGAYLSPDRAKQVKGKVTELGSIEAVNKEYDGNSTVDKYARGIAEQMYGKPDDIRESRGAGEAAIPTNIQEAVQAIVDKVKLDFPGAPKITVLDSAAKLQDKSIAERLRVLQATFLVRAMYDRSTGDIYVFANQFESDNIEDLEKEIVRAILHEVIGHHGLQITFGRSKELGLILDAIYDKHKDEMTSEIQAYGILLPETSVGRRFLTEEWFSNVGIHAADPSLIDRVFAYIRARLRGMGFDVEFTDAELRAMVGRIKGELRKGPGQKKNFFVPGVRYSQNQQKESGDLIDRLMKDPEFVKKFGKTQAIEGYDTPNKTNRPVLVNHGSPTARIIGGIIPSEEGAAGQGIYFTEDFDDLNITRGYKNGQAHYFKTEPINDVMELFEDLEPDEIGAFTSEHVFNKKNITGKYPQYYFYSIEDNKLRKTQINNPFEMGVGEELGSYKSPEDAMNAAYNDMLKHGGGYYKKDRDYRGILTGFVNIEKVFDLEKPLERLDAKKIIDIAREQSAIPLDKIDPEGWKDKAYGGSDNITSKGVFDIYKGERSYDEDEDIDEEAADVYILTFYPNDGNEGDSFDIGEYSTLQKAKNAAMKYNFDDGTINLRGWDLFKKLEKIIPPRDVQNILRKAGYDGKTHLGGWGGRPAPVTAHIGDGKSHRVWVAFDSSQFKSYTNTTWSNDPNIYFSQSQKTMTDKQRKENQKNLNKNINTIWEQDMGFLPDEPHVGPGIVIETPKRFSRVNIHQKTNDYFAIVKHLENLLMTQDPIIKGIVEKQKPGPMGKQGLPVEIDPYIQEELRRGRIANRFKEEVQPLLDEIKRFVTEGKLDPHLIDIFAHTMHSKERNERIALKYPNRPDLQDTGSAIPDTIADKIIKMFKDSGLYEDYLEAIEPARKAGRRKLELEVEYGLKTFAEVTRMANTPNEFKYYFNLSTGLNDTIKAIYEKSDPRRLDDLVQQAERRGVKAWQEHEAHGLQGKHPEEIMAIENTITQLYDTIKEGEHNKHVVALSRLLDIATPNPEEWKKDPTWKKRSVKTDPETGEEKIDWTTESIATRSDEDKQHLVKYYINGKKHYYWFRNKQLARVLNGYDGNELGWLLSANAAITRTFARLATTWSLPFAFFNPQRDIQEAMIHMTTAQGPVMGMKLVKDIPAVFQALILYDSREAMWNVKKGILGMTARAGVSEISATSPKIEKLIEYIYEFNKAGGPTGYTTYLRQQDMFDKINSAFKEATISDKINIPNLKKAFRVLDSSMGEINKIGEHLARVSAYANLREAGFNVTQSASFAKNITINFDKHGQWKALGATWMFFNANVRGPIRMAASLFTASGIAIASAAIWSQVAWRMFNRFFGGDDDDGKALSDKISQYDWDHNLVLMKGDNSGDHYNLLPHPYSWAVFPSIGNIIYDTWFNNLSIEDAATRMSMAVMQAFFPMGIEKSDAWYKSVFQTVMPTSTKGFAHAITGTDYKGDPVFKEQSPFGKKIPEFQLALKRTSRTSKVIARYLAGEDIELKGTGLFLPSVIHLKGEKEISPDTLDLIYNEAFSQLGRVVSQSGKMISSMASNLPRVNKKHGIMGNVGIVTGDIPAWQIPVYSRLYKEWTETVNDKLFYDAARESESVISNFKGIALEGKDKKVHDMSIARQYYETHWKIINGLLTPSQVKSILDPQRITKSPDAEEGERTPALVSLGEKITDTKKVIESLNSTGRAYPEIWGNSSDEPYKKDTPSSKDPIDKKVKQLQDDYGITGEKIEVPDGYKIKITDGNPMYKGDRLEEQKRFAEDKMKKHKMEFYNIYLNGPKGSRYEEEQ